MAKSKAAEEAAPVLEEGVDPDTGQDVNSSKPRLFDASALDIPATAADVREARRSALQREREGYVAAGKKDRVKAVDDELKRLDKEADETTDGEGPEEVA